MRRARFPGGGRARAVASPLVTSVVHAAPDPDALDAIYEREEAGWTYSREGHPNAAVVAGIVDEMEGASGGTVTGSGMSAVLLAILSVARAGDHVIGADQLYGRSLRIMREEMPRLGVETTLVDATEATAVAAAMRDDTRLVLIETVSNPTLRLGDLAGIAEICRSRNVTLAVDATFTTPAALRVLDHGADIVIHSLTKLLSGHSDAMLGYLGTRDDNLGDRIATLSATFGTTPAPFDCWMAERGLYTFALRHARTQETAALLADALAGMAGVKRVFYPGRADHPDADRASTLLGGQGGNMVSFEIDDSREAANALVRALPDVAFAPTLGDIATTLSHPATSSHRAMTAAGRRAIGITEGFFRVSVGCEDADDLIAAFHRATEIAQSEATT